MSGARLGLWLGAALVARPWPSLNMLAALLIGVATFIGLGALSSALSRVFVDTGTPQRVLFFSQGSIWEGQSTIADETVAALLDAPEVARNAQGRAMGAGEVLGSATLEDSVTGLLTRVPVRGTGELATVRRELSIVEGRAFVAGKREVIVGERLAKRMRGIDVGDEIRIHGASWAVVGRFASGDVHESSMMADATTLRDHMAQEGYASALVWLSEAEQAQALIDRFGEESPTPLNGFRESEYYAMLGGMLPHLRVLQVFVAICLLVMLPVCVLHVMSVMVEGSKQDFAVLHALGFSSPSIFVATLLQVVMLASVAIVVAVGAALAVLDGSAFSVGVDFQTIEIEVRVGMETALYGALFGFLATALGCFWPAWKASRQTLVASH